MTDKTPYSSVPTGETTFDFAGQLVAFAKKTNRTIGQTHKLMAIKLFTKIIRETPVDTGEAQGGWIPGYGQIPSGATGQRGAVRPLALVAAITAQTEKPLYLANSVPHAAMLEYGTASYGFSPKAPAGMVRTNIILFSKIVREAVAEAKAMK